MSREPDRQDSHERKSPYGIRAEIPESPDLEIPERELKEEEAGERSGDLLLEILDWAKYILVAVVLGLIITNFVAQRNEVVGSSMLPSLADGDQLIVEKVSRHFGGLSRGDIVTIDGAGLSPSRPEEDLVKRIVAVGGEHVEIRDDMHVYIDGMALEEDYLAAGTVTTQRPFGEYNDLIVPEGYIYVLGDNRSHSADSREFGPIPIEAIHGEVWIRIYPFDRLGSVD